MTLYADIEMMDRGLLRMEQVYSKIKTDKSPPKRIDLTNCVVYMKKGKCHRLDGPAVYNKLIGQSSFYIEGVQLSIEVWAKQATISDEEKAHILFVHG